MYYFRLPFILSSKFVIHPYISELLLSVTSYPDFFFFSPLECRSLNQFWKLNSFKNVQSLNLCLLAMLSSRLDDSNDSLYPNECLIVNNQTLEAMLDQIARLKGARQSQNVTLIAISPTHPPIYHSCEFFRRRGIVSSDIVCYIDQLHQLYQILVNRSV